MSKQIYLHIQEPCHENWEAMSPVEQGRFCQSCAKQVVDFSRMSDSQILDTISKAAGSTCGRFTGNQLERPLVKASIEIPFFLKPYKLVLSSLVPLVIISANASAQVKKGEISTQVATVPMPGLMGKIAMVADDASLIEGRVLDELGKPIKSATIQIKGTKMKTVSGTDGSFSLRLKSGQQKATLLVSYGGYVTKEMAARTNQAAPLEIKLTPDDVVVVGMFISTTTRAKDRRHVMQEAKPEKITVKGQIVNKRGEPLSYATVSMGGSSKQVVTDSEGIFSLVAESGSLPSELSASHVGYRQATTKLDLGRQDLDEIKLMLEDENILDSVIVSGYASQLLTGKVGLMSVVRTVTAIDTLKTAVQKLFKNELFSAFPNPISRGQTLHLRFKQEGDYSLQLFDNSGRLYTEKQLKMVGKNQDFLLAMPATLGSGIYYLKAISPSSKKQFIEKIIVP